MPKTRGKNKIGVEEQGQRVARSMSPYSIRGEAREGVSCSGCHAVYRNKRWYMGVEGELAEGAATVLCPACQRMEDNEPAGVVTLTGEYLLEHENEILNTLKNTEAKAREKNPLARIMEIRQEEKILTVNTTDEKLAQKLGRDVFKAHHGDLHYKWSQGERFVRVNWAR